MSRSLDLAAFLPPPCGEGIKGGGCAGARSNPHP